MGSRSQGSFADRTYTQPQQGMFDNNQSMQQPVFERPPQMSSMPNSFNGGGWQSPYGINGGGYNVAQPTPMPTPMPSMTTGGGLLSLQPQVQQGMPFGGPNTQQNPYGICG